MFTKIKTIYFDLDGVLVTQEGDYNPSQGLNIQRDVFDIAAKQTVEELRNESRFLPNINAETKYMTKYFGQILDKLNLPSVHIKTLLDRHFSSRKTLFPEVEKLLSDLQTNYHLGLISNAFPSRRIYVLEQLDINNYFDKEKIIISAELGAWKPDPTIYDHAIKVAECLPNEILYLDDKLKFLESAKRQEIPNLILVGSSEEVTEDIVKISSVHELPDLLPKI